MLSAETMTKARSGFAARRSARRQAVKTPIGRKPRGNAMLNRSTSELPSLSPKTTSARRPIVVSMKPCRRMCVTMKQATNKNSQLCNCLQSGNARRRTGCEDAFGGALVAWLGQNSNAETATRAPTVARAEKSSRRVTPARCSEADTPVARGRIVRHLSKSAG